MPDWFTDVYAGKYHDVEAFLDGTIAFVRQQESEPTADPEPNWRQYRSLSERIRRQFGVWGEAVAPARHPAGMATDGDRRLAAFAAAHHSVFRLGDARGRRTLGVADATPRGALTGAASTTASSACRARRLPCQSELLAAAWTGGDARRRSRIAPRRASTRFPGARAHPIEITCVRWDRSQVPGLIVHEQRRLERGRHRARSTGSRS